MTGRVSGLVKQTSLIAAFKALANQTRRLRSVNFKDLA